MDAQEQITKFQEFFDAQHKASLLDKAAKGDESIVIDFTELSKFDIALAESLLEKPEDTIKAAEYALAKFDLGVENPNIKPRFKNLPKSSLILVNEIRSKHIDKLLEFKGIVRQKSDVRPQVTNARFECPSCGNIMSVLQLDTKFKEPISCSCGRKGKFNLVSKELVDAQKLVIEEAPEDLDGGDQPKRINVFLKNDLVSPLSDRKTNPGSKVTIVGVLKEVPIILREGGKSTRFDLMFDANFVEPVQEEFSSLIITPEQKEEILKLAEDPEVYEKLIESMAPTIYGHERIKEALILQLFGGVKKKQDDGVQRRGDIHILLVGDPGSGKSQLLKRVAIVAPKSRFVSGKGASGAGLCVAPQSTVLLNPGGMESISKVVESNLSSPTEVIQGVWRQENVSTVKIQSLSHDLKLHSKHPAAIWKLRSPAKVYVVTLRSGKRIELTGNTKLLTIEDGRVSWTKSSELSKTQYVGTARKLIGGEIDKRYTADLINSNPVLHNVKNSLPGICDKLTEKYGTLRKAAKALSLNENNLYHNWKKTEARGNIHLRDFQKLCEAAGIEWREKIDSVSLYNGKIHNLPKYLDNDLLYAAGLVAGDGDMRPSRETTSVRFSNSNDKLRSEFTDIIRAKFNLKCDIQRGNQARPTSVRFHSKLLGEILINLGIPCSPKSNILGMSETLLKLKNGLLSEYIAGLFDTDGCVQIRKTRGSDSISFCTVSEKLVRQMQLVLLRYEIHSKIRNARPPTDGKIKGIYWKYELVISDLENIRRFKENIHLRHPDKARKLEILAKQTKATNSNVDIVPGVGPLVKEALKSRGIQLKKAGWHKNFSRSGLVKVVDKYLEDDKELHELAHADVFWEEIMEIRQEKPDYEYVYDLTVEDSHNFIVDGVLVHNTAAVVKDEFLRGWALEAGALVLANRGIVCIDELDKMSKEDTSAMHEALEQQSVSISKANIQATLRAETTVLAAANPKFGRFDPYEILAKQIELPSTLINRFDLIFPVKDLPDQEKDDKLASFILKLHKDEKSNPVTVETSLIKRYIAYAKQNIFPKLTEQALSEIKTYFVKMRNSGGKEEKVQSIPISARQLEGLVRLAEASARTRLSDKVTKKDAQRAIDLLHHCLTLIGLDTETGKFDMDRFTTGITASQRGHINAIRDIITGLEKEIGKMIPIADVVREAEIKGIPENETNEVLDKLSRSGDIFRPRPDSISKI